VADVKVTGKDLKQLRRPDEFQLVAGKVMEWLLARQRPILIGLGAAAGVAVIAWGAAAWRSHREAKAGEALSAALQVAARPIAGEAGQPGAETFPSKAERAKAAIASFEKVRAGHSGSMAAQTALFQIGLVKQQSGDAAGAVPHLEEFLKGAGKDNPVRATALEALGYAHEKAGKLDAARAAYGQIKDAGSPARAAYQLARLALAEKRPEAKDLLAAVAKEFPKEPVAMEANLLLEVAPLMATSAPAPAPKGK